MEENNAAPSLCKNGCGFYGSPNFEGLCSRCHRDAEMEQQKKESFNASSPRSVHNLCAGLQGITLPAKESKGISENATHASIVQPDQIEEKSDNDTKPKLVVKGNKPKCALCNKRLGLIEQYTCHCNSMFCTRHRLPEEHKCTYDYKEQGRSKLQSANPKIDGVKVSKI